MSSTARMAPPDQRQRERALDPNKSVLVQAPAGSGKTDLLTRRFLRLLAEVDDPAQIVAITFTKAAAAEMRHRIVSELEKAANREEHFAGDEFSMDALAARALRRSREAGWNLVELPAQLRISTIDSFCRELALQQPLLSGLGGGLDIADQPDQLYQLAARRTMQQIAQVDSTGPSSEQQQAIEVLLLWRDNNWQEIEGQLIEMLKERDRWMQDFVLEREPEWQALRARLERPFAQAVTEAIEQLTSLLGQRPYACTEALELARFACEQSGNRLHRELAERAEFPCGPFHDSDSLEDARQAFLCLAQFLLTGTGTLRRAVNVTIGFPPDHKREKQRMLDLVRELGAVPGLEAALAGLAELPPARYTEEDWALVRACFTLLRHAAGELRVAFAEAGVVDFIEVAQVAQRVLEGEDRMPTDAALAIADGIHHLLVDEFQDTSRRQHRLISSLVAAWPDAARRTVFVVGDPLQSIYFFRDADAELFPRVQAAGLELPTGEPFLFDFAPLTSNFRTAPRLVNTLNETFSAVFGIEDGSGVRFCPAEPARTQPATDDIHFVLHLDFIPQTARLQAGDDESAQAKERTEEIRAAALEAQSTEILSLIRTYSDRMEQARARGEKFRVAVLGRTRAALVPIAKALRDAAVPFRAVDLEPLAARPEVLDAIALAKALFNPEDRVAWLGVLRAPWCGLTLDDLHTLASADDPNVLSRPIPELLRTRASFLSDAGQRAAQRVLTALDSMPAFLAQASTVSLGTSMQQIWKQLGGEHCVDATARANLDLLWKCMDELPAGEPDLLGSGLDAALARLTAKPDPEAGVEVGVQLMTIHKSKGLEFEVVIVPEMQVPSTRTGLRMLSWLERGVGDPQDSREITEFLIAPMQQKGADKGSAKAWVDRVYRARERQEMRRILYVAATRARDKLHLFARPAYKETEEGELILCEPTDSLLSTAWPALGDHVRERFEAWKDSRTTLPSIAAAATNKAIVIPQRLGEQPSKSALLRRLPENFARRDSLPWPASKDDGIAAGTTVLYDRHEGGVRSRALGIAVHAFFEELARLGSNGRDAARAALASIRPRIAARVRSLGVPPAEAEQIAAKALEVTLRASHDPVAVWILSPHREAESEIRWAGEIKDTLRTVQADRVFRAGAAPGSTADDVWWIVDYKTAHTDAPDPDAIVQQLRPVFAPQLELYAQVLRNVHGTDLPVHAGLYYPRMLRFDWWKL